MSLSPDTKQANIGLHTMRNEHFGISVVELMAGGAIVVAHDSGGPQMDIIKNGTTGFLASSPDEYADKMAHIISMKDEQLDRIRSEARDDVKRFSDDSFRKNLSLLLTDFFNDDR